MKAWVDFLCIAALPVVLCFVTVRFLGLRVRERVSGASLVAGSVLLLLALTSLVLLAFETHLRFFYDASDGDNRTQVSRRWFERHWRDNSFGVRNAVEYALRRTPGRRRISPVRPMLELFAR